MASTAWVREPACVATQWEPFDLPERVLNTMAEARAPSIRCLYALKLSVFSARCQNRDLDPVTFNVSMALSFLQEMLDKQCSSSTIKVYAAAIAAFHFPIAGRLVGRAVIQFIWGAMQCTMQVQWGVHFGTLWGGRLVAPVHISKVLQPGRPCLTGQSVPVAQWLEHCISSAKVVVSIPREHMYWQYKCIAWMHCKSLWKKASAKCINVNVKCARRINPLRLRTVPPWDLPTVLRALKGPPFEPSQSTSTLV